MWSRFKTKSTQGWLAARSYQARQVIRTWVTVRAHCCASIIITGTSWATVALVLRYWHFHYCLNVLGVATEARFFADIHEFRKISRQTYAEICRVNSWLFPIQYVVTVMKEYCNTLLLYLSALANQLYAILSVKLFLRGLVACIFYMLVALCLHLDSELSGSPWFMGVTRLLTCFSTCLPLMVQVEIHFRCISHTKLFQSLYHTNWFFAYW